MFKYLFISIILCIFAVEIIKNKSMEFKNSKEAADWMIEHPEEQVYDQYGNFAAYYPDSYDGPHVEYNYEVDIENWIWDMDKMSIEEFIDRFDGTILQITLKKLESYNTLNSLRRIDKSQDAVSFEPIRLRKWYTIDTDVRLEKYGYNLQRPYVWTLLQQQELIWSIFMGRPVPPFVFIQHAEDNSALGAVTMMVIDGKQRLTTIFRYMDNEFPIIVDGKEVYFKDLDAMAQHRINFYDIRAQIYYSYKEDPITDDEKIIIFNHYNFAGTSQEEEHKNKLQSFIANK